MHYRAGVGETDGVLVYVGVGFAKGLVAVL
jgi:hypothetical protein